MNRGFTYYIRDKTNPDLVYYGSSGLPTLDDRMKSHIKNFNNWKKNKDNGYCSSYKVLEKDNYEYDTIEVVYFDTKHDLRQYERPLIEDQICVNKDIPNRTIAEWLKANPNYHADHYQKNKEQKLKKTADYYQVNKEKILKKAVDYYQKNKEQKLKKNADYYQVNKEQILTKNKEKFNCPCGGKYTHKYKSIHKKTKKHQKWVKSQIIDK